MFPIVTVTMNPALDLTSSVDHVVPEHKLRCGPVRIDPGGGGVNVTHAIKNLGGISTAIYPLGGPSGAAYRALTEAAGIPALIVRIAGRTRENFTIDETSSGTQYRFVQLGPTLREPEWRACLSVIGDHLPVGGFLVASGSLPPGVPTDFYATLARVAAANSVRLVVDAAGAPLHAALGQGVYLIKPSRDELVQLVGARSELTPDEQLTAARGIVARGEAEMVALTLGAAGAVLVSATATLRLATPRVRVASTVGAGDAFLAGLIWRLAQGSTIANAFRTAVAAGSAAAMRPATELCHVDDVRRLEQTLVPTEEWNPSAARDGDSGRARDDEANQ